MGLIRLIYLFGKDWAKNKYREYGHVSIQAWRTKSQHKDRQQSYLTLRLLMSYIYGAPILDVSRSHTTTQHSR